MTIWVIISSSGSAVMRRWTAWRTRVALRIPQTTSSYPVASALGETTLVCPQFSSKQTRTWMKIQTNITNFRRQNSSYSQRWIRSCAILSATSDYGIYNSCILTSLRPLIYQANGLSAKFSSETMDLTSSGPRIRRTTTSGTHRFHSRNPSMTMRSGSDTS